MRSRLLVNLLLLLAVAALGMLYYSQPAEKTDTPPTVSNMDSDNVTSIRVERPDAATIELEKTDGDWRLTAPIKADAEDSRVASVLLLPMITSESRYPATDQKLDRFGLSPPQLTLQFDNQTFIVGDKNPLNEEQRYLLHDEQIHVIDGRLHQRLSAPLNYYVNPSLTPPDSRITRIRLPDGVISQQDEGWRIIPEHLADKPGRIVNAWGKARASYLKQMDSAPDDSRSQVTLEFADHESITYRLVKTSPQVILARPDISMQYHLRQDEAEQLLLVEPQADQEQESAGLPVPSQL